MKAKVVKVKRVVVDEGVHNARVFGLIDLGTQTAVFNGKRKEMQKVSIGVELVDTELELEDGTMTRFTVWQDYSLPISGRSYIKEALEKILEIEIQLPDDDEPLELDLSRVINKDCQVLIKHGESKKKPGELYANIDKFISVPKGKDGKRLKIAPLLNETILFDLDDFDKDAFDKIPGWIKDKIKESPEFKNNVLLDDGNNAKLQEAPKAAPAKGKPAVPAKRGKK
jgi:hypothetical protein